MNTLELLFHMSCPWKSLSLVKGQQNALGDKARGVSINALIKFNTNTVLGGSNRPLVLWQHTWPNHEPVWA